MKDFDTVGDRLFPYLYVSDVVGGNHADCKCTSDAVGVIHAGCKRVSDVVGGIHADCKMSPTWSATHFLAV